MSVYLVIAGFPNPKYITLQFSSNKQTCVQVQEYPKPAEPPLHPPPFPEAGITSVASGLLVTDFMVKCLINRLPNDYSHLTHYAYVLQQINKFIRRVKKKKMLTINNMYIRVGQNSGFRYGREKFSSSYSCM